MANISYNTVESMRASLGLYPNLPQISGGGGGNVVPSGAEETITDTSIAMSYPDNIPAGTVEVHRIERLDNTVQATIRLVFSALPATSGPFAIAANNAALAGLCAVSITAGLVVCNAAGDIIWNGRCVVTAAGGLSGTIRLDVGVFSASTGEDSFSLTY